jgi:pyruvate/2-oxoglutarate dehydrogenase complex dihydrolipoamide acyltransferase (E2) component
MPQLGESIAEATIIRILLKEGEVIEADSDVIEVETNKAVMSVTSPCSGNVSQILVEEGKSYPVGAILGYVEVDARKQLGWASRNSRKRRLSRKDVQRKPIPEPSQVEPTVKGLPVPAHVGGATHLSPRMKARMTELGLHAADLAGIAGSGAGGRVTIEDLEKFLEAIERNRITPAPQCGLQLPGCNATERDETVGDSRLASPAWTPCSPHRRQRPQRPARRSTRPRPALALSENSAPAGRRSATASSTRGRLDIGFAVEAEDGVLVPVIRNSDQFSLADLVERYDRLVDLARQRRLPAGETGGSIATVTNYGVFGLTIATPIPLPEQTLLLGMGCGQLVPYWDAEKEAFMPITEAAFTLSFDHRVLTEARRAVCLSGFPNC